MSASITPAVGAPHARLLSVGAYRPSRVVTNAEICERIDSTDEWIRERSGIIERRWAAEGESVVDMATAAAEVALDRAGIRADQVDACEDRWAYLAIGQADGQHHVVYRIEPALIGVCRAGIGQVQVGQRDYAENGPGCRIDGADARCLHR